MDLQVLWPGHVHGLQPLSKRARRTLSILQRARARLAAVLPAALARVCHVQGEALGRQPCLRAACSS